MKTNQDVNSKTFGFEYVSSIFMQESNPPMSSYEYHVKAKRELNNFLVYYKFIHIKFSDYSKNK